MDLTVLDRRYGIVRLAADSAVPDWALQSEFFSITRTVDEVSVVCEESVIPEGTSYEGAWRILKVSGPLDFSLTGVLSSLSVPLAANGVSVFAVSTFDTDYLLIKETCLDLASESLEAAGHRFV